MWSDAGLAQPSPTIGHAINGGFPWLEVQCSRCRTTSSIDLTAIKRPDNILLHALEGKLRCQKCGKRARAGDRLPPLKDTAQSVMANVMAMTHATAGDEILKNTFANNAFENCEISAYKLLLALCGRAGAENARPVLEASLREEEQMAKWIAANVKKVTLDYLNREVRAAA